MLPKSLTCIILLAFISACVENKKESKEDTKQEVISHHKDPRIAARIAKLAIIDGTPPIQAKKRLEKTYEDNKLVISISQDNSLDQHGYIKSSKEVTINHEINESVPVTVLEIQRSFHESYPWLVIKEDSVLKSSQQKSEKDKTLIEQPKVNYSMVATFDSKGIPADVPTSMQRHRNQKISKESSLNCSELNCIVTTKDYDPDGKLSLQTDVKLNFIGGLWGFTESGQVTTNDKTFESSHQALYKDDQLLGYESKEKQTLTLQTQDKKTKTVNRTSEETCKFTSDIDMTCIKTTKEDGHLIEKVVKVQRYFLKKVAETTTLENLVLETNSESYDQDGKIIAKLSSQHSYSDLRLDRSQSVEEIFSGQTHKKTSTVVYTYRENGNQLLSVVTKVNDKKVNEVIFTY